MPKALNPLPRPVRGKKDVSRGKLQKEDATAQSAAMLVPRLLGTKSHEEIGRLFGLSAQTVRKRLSEARQTQLTDLARDIICERMLPKALAILDIELEKGNYDAAKDVLYGAQVLQKTGKATIEHVTSHSPTLDAIRKERSAVEAEILPPTDEPDSGSS